MIKVVNVNFIIVQVSGGFRNYWQRFKRIHVQVVEKPIWQHRLMQRETVPSIQGYARPKNGSSLSYKGGGVMRAIVGLAFAFSIPLPPISLLDGLKPCDVISR